ncbi:phenylalanine--tRNA ligase beta subunit [Hypericibacter adhaerens]|uniref:Phenylalanine--tRNA ligase beta subunit n=1 Tax=Hypericibacter adhaerens TaxID=2602016 RepID=A0A5J6MSN4_9PROT|nr:phenylalanine--tRNA ligase subunit beta [Hypericibacter adhaerens]QEX20329.1 phenylalanine--tRNA ligase beta subunit [Hypericibacter adhaerens]
MKFTLGWLKDHLDTNADAAAIADRLTKLGLEVESVEDRSRDLAPFRVAYVVEAKPHPNADRLRVCMIDVGEGAPIQVVCGAPNARTGMKGVFAPAGSHIPGTGLDLKKGNIRGVDSNGMLCSAREMGLGQDHDGIIELPADAPVGQPFAKVMGLDDPLFDIAITADRADCLGVRGIARDLAAAGLGKLKPFAVETIAGSFDSPVRWQRDLPANAQDACPYVVGRYFRNVKNGPSPQWLKDRLVAIGLRPISALVDITNYVTFDLGRPLHVFDADKLDGDPTMRFARTGEEILALDGRSYRLEGDMTVIADRKAVHGIGGIMGGEHSGCTPDTKNVFLEVALFDPKRTAATGRRLGIESDARYRFERGLDPVSAEWGAEIAAKLVRELCGGEASRVVSAGAMPEWRRKLSLRTSRIFALGGLDLPVAESKRILEALGCEVTGDGQTLAVTPPSWRADIEGEADLVEEVVRVKGFDEVPAVPLERETPLPEPAVTLGQRRAQQAKRILASRGLLEAVTYSFTSSAAASFFGGVKPELMLANPISADLDVMRPSILPNLVMAAARNAARGLSDLGLFEVGPQYADATPEGQALVATGLRVGQTGPRHWRDRPRAVDAFDAKADALALLTALGAPVENLQVTADAPAWYHPGQSGQFRLGPTVLARFGALHPRVTKGLDLEGAAVAFEVMLDTIPQPKAKAGPQRPPLKASAYQPVERDFAFLVASDVPADKLIRAVKSAEKALIQSVSLFDLYEGDRIEAGKKSVAISVTLQPSDRTLTDAEIEQVSAKIVAAVTKATGAVLRS